MIKAAKANDQTELLAIFGTEAEDLLVVRGQDCRQEGAPADSGRVEGEMVAASQGANTKTLVIGNEEWPYPIPLVKDSGGWRFDTAAGRQEILFRRIGRNELQTIRACRVYLRAQKEYAAQSHDGNQRDSLHRDSPANPASKTGFSGRLIPAKSLAR